VGHGGVEKRLRTTGIEYVDQVQFAVLDIYIQATSCSKTPSFKWEWHFVLKCVYHITMV